MEVLMPQLGETVTEGTVARWVKNQGDAVQSGDILFEIETDKTSMEIPATVSGVLAEIRVAQGAVVAVGTVVAVLKTSGAEPAAAPAGKPATAAPPAPAAPAAVAAPVAAAPAVAASAPAGGKSSAGRRADGVTVTPLARRLASQAGISLDSITGTGPRGRIMGRDVEQQARRPQATPAAALAAGMSGAQVAALFKDVPYREVPMDTMRKTIARRLIEAKQSIPHFYLSSDVSIDALEALRRSANEAAQGGGDAPPAYKISVNDCMIKALAVALRRVPAANAVLAEDRILQFDRADIGVAVAIDGGLITPVLRNADSKSLAALSNEMKQLAGRARDRKLTAAEYQGGSISISNLGMYGVNEFAAIINPPQSAILAVGAATRVPTEAADGGVRFVSRITVTLSCDHRVIDGAIGAMLLKEFRFAIENPILLFV